MVDGGAATAYRPGATSGQLAAVSGMLSTLLARLIKDGELQCGVRGR